MRRATILVLGAVAAVGFALGGAEAQVVFNNPSVQFHLDQIGATTPDSSGNGYDGTGVAGTAITTGRWGGALKLAATSDGFSVATRPALETSSVTFAAWVRQPTGGSGIYETILGKGGFGCSDSAYALYTAANGGLQTYVTVDVNGASQTVKSPVIPPADIWNGNWHAIAGVYDGSKLTLWVDGTQRGSGTAPAGASGINYSRYQERRLSIGRYDQAGCSTPDFQYKGEIDEVRVYGRALSDAEMAKLQDPAATSPPVIPAPGTTPAPTGTPTPAGSATPVPSSTAGPTPPVTEVNTKRPVITKLGAKSKTEYLYGCTKGEWTGLPTNPVFEYEWFERRNVIGATGEYTESPVFDGQNFLVDGNRTGKTYFCRVSVRAASGAKLQAVSVTKLLTAFDPLASAVILEKRYGNVRIRGIDVFQYTQPIPGATMYAYGSVPFTPAPFGGFTSNRCGGGTPTNIAYPACNSRLTNFPSYAGVHMDAEKPTSAIVYADRYEPATNPKTKDADFEVTLRARVDGKLLNGKLTQLIAPKPSLAPYVTLEERAREDVGVRFDLPQGWLQAGVSNNSDKLQLEAKIALRAGAYPVIECGALETACNKDNEWKQTVPVRTDFRALRARSIELLQPKQKSLPSAESIMRPSIKLLPGTEAMYIEPYSAQVPITPDDFELGDCPKRKDETRSDATRLRACRQAHVKLQIRTWQALSEANRTGYDVLIAPALYPTGNGYDEPGVKFGSPLSNTTEPGEQPILLLRAKVSDADLSPGHELLHAIGFRHASNACGGGTEGQKGEDWAPDEMGRLQGLSFVPATGDRVVDSAETPLIDIMSYCKSIGPQWISPRTWNHAEYQMKVLTGSHPRLRSASVAASGKTGAALVLGSYQGGGVATIERVLPAAPGNVAVPAVADSPVVVRSLDASGAVLAETGGAVDETEDGSGATFLAAVADGAVRVEVVADGAVADTQAQSKRPSLKLITPRKGARAGKELKVSWRTTDPDSKDRLASVGFSANGKSDWRTVFQGPDKGTVTVPGSFLESAKGARVRVTVNDGFSSAVATSKPFRSAGHAPSAVIVRPTDGEDAQAGAPVTLLGAATDDHGQRLKGRALTWFAGKRRLGRGEQLRTELPAGRIKLRLVARDSRGRTSSVLRTLKVKASALTFETLKGPARVKPGARTAKLRVATSTAARLVVGGRSTKVGPKTRTLEVRLPKAPKRGLLKLSLVARDGNQKATATVLVARV